MDNEMIERCAKSLFAARWPSSNWEDWKKQASKGWIDHHYGMVLSIIKAMREPTDKMLGAGAFIDTAQSGVYSCSDVYQAMIDSITNDR